MPQFFCQSGRHAPCSALSRSGRSALPVWRRLGGVHSVWGFWWHDATEIIPLVQWLKYETNTCRRLTGSITTRCISIYPSKGSGVLKSSGTDPIGPQWASCQTWIYWAMLCSALLKTHGHTPSAWTGANSCVHRYWGPMYTGQLHHGGHM